MIEWINTYPGDILIALVLIAAVITVIIACWQQKDDVQVRANYKLTEAEFAAKLATFFMARRS